MEVFGMKHFSCNIGSGLEKRYITEKMPFNPIHNRIGDLIDKAFISSHRLPSGNEFTLRLSNLLSDYKLSLPYSYYMNLLWGSDRIGIVS